MYRDDMLYILFLVLLTACGARIDDAPETMEMVGDAEPAECLMPSASFEEEYGNTGWAVLSRVAEDFPEVAVARAGCRYVIEVADRPSCGEQLLFDRYTLLNQVEEWGFTVPPCFSTNHNETKRFQLDYLLGLKLSAWSGVFGAAPEGGVVVEAGVTWD